MMKSMFAAATSTLYTVQFGCNWCKANSLIKLDVYGHNVIVINCVAAEPIKLSGIVLSIIMLSVLASI